MKQFDDGNIQIQYSDENEPCVLELMNQVLIAYETITSLFKLKNYDRKIIIQLYNSVEELHKEVFGKKREEWEVALECEDGTLKLVTPLNPGNVHSYSDITTYLFGLNDAKTTYSYQKLNINDIKSFSDAYFITLSLINIYGINKIIKIYKKAKNYNRILNASDNEINNKIIKYYAEAV